MILRTSARMAPSRAWKVCTCCSTSDSLSCRPAASFIFRSLLDDLQQEFLRGFVVRGGGERIEHAAATAGAIAQRIQRAGRAEQSLRRIVIAQCEQHAEFAQRVLGTIRGQQTL